MDTSNKDQFKKLTNGEKDKALHELVLHPVDILCKSANDLFVAKPLVYRPAEQLLIEFAQKEPLLRSGEEIIGQFLFNRESLYIFKCDYRNDGKTHSLFLNSDFYMIQRRENYRLKFPNSLNSKVFIKSNGPLLIGKVSDLSTTGIRVGSTDKSEALAIGKEISLELQVVGNEPLHIKAVLRHRTEGSEVIKDKKVTFYYYGFQFINISLENEKSLSRINMELYRNFLQKVNG